MRQPASTTASPADHLPEPASSGGGDIRVLQSLWRVVSQFKGRIFLAVFLLVLAKVATVAVPLSLKRIVDALSRPEQLVTLPVMLLVVYAALRFASTLFGELRDLAFSRVTQYTVATYAANTFAHLHELGSRYHSKRRIGGLLPDIDRGTSGIAFLLGVGLFTLIPTLLEIVMVAAIISTRYSLWYTAIIAVTFLIYCSFTLAITARRAIFQRRVNRLDSSAKSLLADSLINYDTVKYFTNEKQESRRFGDIMKGWIEAAVENQKALFFLHVGQSAIIGLGVAAVMLVAGNGVVSRHMTVGDLILINAYVIQICLPLNSLGFVYREAKDALINTEKLFNLLREKPEIHDPVDKKALIVVRGEIEFEQVNFGYEPARPILHDVSFKIAAGNKVAVVGGSGSGKSTLARLLLRFHDVGSGRVMVDGRDIRTVTARSVREAIGVVPQDTLLFNETIGYNIGYGRNGASMEEVVAAAKAAHVHEFIESLPQKYDTPVGERGVMLSGGEKQRIAIARAILKNPPIMVFDEATSALDTQSERAIQAELDQLARNRTTLVIAHRLSTIVDANEILVMEKGRIVERGKHSALLAQGGLYARLWQLQERTEEAGAEVH